MFAEWIYENEDNNNWDMLYEIFSLISTFTMRCSNDIIQKIQYTVSTQSTQYTVSVHSTQSKNKISPNEEN